MRFTLKTAITGLVLVGLLAGLAPAQVSPQDQLTLNDCIELALQNRASIIAALGSEKAASAGKRAALGAFLPRLSASYGYSKSKSTDIKFEQEQAEILGVDTLSWDATDQNGTPVVVDIPQPQYGASSIVETTSPDQDRTSKGLGLDANMPLIVPEVWFDYKASRDIHKAAQLDVLHQEQDLIFSVKQAYFGYLAFKENLTVQEQAVERAEEQLKLIESRYELGSASKSDVLRQRVQYGRDQLSLLDAQNQLVNAEASLAFVIGVDPALDWDFSPDYTTREYDGTLEEAIAFGLEHRPGLLLTETRVGVAENYLRSAKMDYLPKLYGFASYDWSSGTRGDTLVFDQSSQSRTFGFNITYNLFDGFLRESRVTNNKVSVNNRKAELSDARNLTVRDIKTAYLNIQQIRERKEVAEENVEATDEDLKITRERYNLGAATILDLLLSQGSLVNAQVDYIRADFDLNLAIADLEKAMGKM